MTATRGRAGGERSTAGSTLTLLVAVALLTGALYWAKSIFIPVALAVLLSFVLSPAVAWVQRRGVGRTTAVVLVVGCSLLTCVGVGALVAQQVAGLGPEVTKNGPKIKDKVTRAKAYFLGSEESPLGKLVEDVTDIISPKPSAAQPAPDAGGGFWSAFDKPVAQTRPMRVVVENESSSWPARIQALLNPAVEIIGTAAFANVLVIFMLLKKEDLRNRMIRLIGDGQVTTTTKAVDDASNRISSYLLTQLLLNAAFGAAMVVGLLFLGLPYPTLWGFIAFIMRYVPYIGTPIGVIPPALFSLAVSPDGSFQPVYVIALFVGAEAICNNVFEPWLYGSSMGLSQVAQLVAAGFWAFLWGPIGLILSGPLTVCLLVLGKYVPRFSFLEVILGDEPALEPRVAFYQRLAARDQDEAADIALEHLKTSTPAGVFDGVIVPALILAKRDHDRGTLSDPDWDEAVRAAREVAEEVAAAGRPKGEEGAVVVDGADDRIRLLFTPAKDAADLAALEMLVHLLDPAKWEVEVRPVEGLVSELVERVAAFRPAAVVVGSLPPGGTSHTRYMITRIRAKHPNLKLLVGRWGQEGGDEDRAAATAGVAGVDWQHCSIADTVKHLAEWAPMLADAADKNDAAASAAAAGANRPRVGTPAASVA